MKLHHRLCKRSFDLVGSFLGLVLTWWIIMLAYILSMATSKGSGFYKQVRIGKNGKRFTVIKIRTMRNDENIRTNVTTIDSPRITHVGMLLRRLKIDELPQLLNVFVGQMSFVGPRPDVTGFADCLTGDDRIVLSVRPGITGPATLKYRDEEILLAKQPDPEKYNREVIWPDKVRINKQYVLEYSFWEDIKYIIETIFYL